VTQATPRVVIRQLNAVQPLHCRRLHWHRRNSWRGTDHEVLPARLTGRLECPDRGSEILQPAHGLDDVNTDRDWYAIGGIRRSADSCRSSWRPDYHRRDGRDLGLFDASPARTVRDDLDARKGHPRAGERSSMKSPVPTISASFAISRTSLFVRVTAPQRGTISPMLRVEFSRVKVTSLSAADLDGGI